MPSIRPASAMSCSTQYAGFGGEGGGPVGRRRGGGGDGGGDGGGGEGGGGEGGGGLAAAWARGGNGGGRVEAKERIFPTGTRTQVDPVKAGYPNQLDYREGKYPPQAAINKI